MINNTGCTMLKWFLIGFGIRTILALVVFFLALVLGLETLLLYLADLPTLMFLLLAEMVLPQSLHMALVSGHPFYVPMNFIAGLLWGGIFLLIPLAGDWKEVLRRSWTRKRKGSLN